MATPVIMPRQGQSVESCLITEWHKQKGDSIEIGDVLFSYETDKASFEEEAKEKGTLLEVYFQEEEDVPVLMTVAVIGEVGESTDAFRPTSASESVVETLDTVQPQPEEQREDVPITLDPERPLRISPRARMLAQKSNANVQLAQPSGPDGRIIERDIVALVEAKQLLTPAAKADYTQSDQAIEGTGLGGRITTLDLKQPVQSEQSLHAVLADAAYRDEKLTNMRKVIAKSMHHSLSSTAQLTLNASFDATEILAYRQKLKKQQEQLALENITLNDIVLFAVARTLPNYEALNAHLLGDTLRIYSNVHLGVAVDTERGLMVPTIFDANKKSLNQISHDMKRVASACQKGAINPDELQGATFTLTNLGVFGIESFTPVLNPPQTGILGISTIQYKVKEDNGQFTHYPAMGLSLTFDHRAIDGAPAARFLQELSYNLANFSVLLAK